jgi:hypothetical protein
MEDLGYTLICLATLILLGGWFLRFAAKKEREAAQKERDAAQSKPKAPPRPVRDASGKFTKKP